MQPQNKSDGFQTKYRNFHPQSTVWLHNPFDHDVVFNVADEHNNPYQYRMPAGKTSELPGGAVATLGVKAVVDELIQNSAADALSMWEAGVRQRHEDSVIIRIKEAKNAAVEMHTGEVNLVSYDEVADDQDVEAVIEEEMPVFPTKDMSQRLADELEDEE